MSITIREKKLKSGKKSLYLDIYKDGQRHYEFLKLYLTGDRQHDKEVRQLAESIKAKRQLEIQHSAHGFTPNFKKKANFVDYFQKVKDSITTSTQQEYNNVLNYVKSYSGDHVQFSAIDKRWLEGFKDHLLENVQKNTARTYFTILKAVLNRAVKEEIIPASPADKVDNFEKQSPDIEYLTTEELQKLAKAECHDSDLKEAFLFSCYTGLRFSDIESLKWNHINNGQIELRQQKTKDNVYIPLGQQAKNILDRLDRDRELVFNLPHNVTCNIWLKRWAAKAGLERWKRIEDSEGNVIQKGLIYHVSRHTFAVQVLAHGGDIYTLKDLLGHESVQSTEVYAKVVNKTKDDAVNRLPEINL